MNQDPPTHCIMFLSRDIFDEYISIKIVYCYLKYYGLFPYSKYSSTLIIAIKNSTWLSHS